MQQLTDDLWLLRYPLSLLGTQIGRNVTLIRMRSGEIVIHSTAPFTASEVELIRALGHPAMLVDATLFHDTFAEQGRAAFPEVPYAAPDGFVGRTTAISSLAANWPDDFGVLELAGMPKVREHAVLHRPSRTMIVADLVFNFGPTATVWTRNFFRWAGGVREFPGMTRLFRSFIRDRDAFRASVEQLLAWDFDRLIVAHGDVVETNAKVALSRAFETAGVLWRPSRAPMPNTKP